MYRVLIYKGSWKKKPTRKAVEESFDGMECDSFVIVEMEFVQPCDEDLACEIRLVVDLDTTWGDPEHNRDYIIENLIREFDPEFETMIEVEVEDAC